MEPLFDLSPYTNPSKHPLHRGRTRYTHIKPNVWRALLNLKQTMDGNETLRRRVPDTPAHGTRS